MASQKLIQPVKGMRDFYPEEWAFQKWFYRQIQEVAESFGFQEYEGPTLEPLDLYAAKSGGELVKKQAFTLTDKNGKILALRPEMTPTLARMIAQKANSLVFPIKWFSYGRRFRYENPQKGRGREFFQWDCDILGTESPQADAEVITIAAIMYQKLGLTSQEVKIRVNDRQYLQSELQKIGIDDNLYLSTIKVVDKKDKVTQKVFEKMLTEVGLTRVQIAALQKILADKKGYQQSAWLKSLFEILEKTDISTYIEFDPTIVRGLDYYTRTVFEGWDVKSKFRSIWGGGRYDNLTSDVGASKRIPGVGFAMGDMTLLEVLKANNKYPQLKTCPGKILVTVFERGQKNAEELAKKLRAQRIKTEIYLDPSVKLDKQFKYADKKGIEWVAIIGPDEAKNNTVSLKNLITRTQVVVAQEVVIKILKNNDPPA
ncbi:MAG: histidine--tRNA ligase [Candidatus Shapirobacteria bacterium]